MTSEPLDNKNNWLQYTRKKELESAIKYFPPKNASVLEVGGKDGFQAELMSKMGYDVVSIDAYPATQQYFQVKKMDVTRLEFLDETFDVVFSSHVIAHLSDKSSAFSEMRRVLKEDGILVFIVPTPWWVLITSFWHYILFPIHLRDKIRKNNILITKQEKSYAENSHQKTTLKKLINFLFLHPLGTNPSFIHEFYYFSKSYWKKIFIRNNFKVSNIENAPLLYSGYGVCKFKFLAIRKILSVKITSSYCFILKKEKIKDKSV